MNAFLLLVIMIIVVVVVLPIQVVAVAKLRAKTEIVIKEMGSTEKRRFTHFGNVTLLERCFVDDRGFRVHLRLLGWQNCFQGL